MLDVYAEFAENVLAMPVVKGAKTDSEKFPGAVVTYCIEGADAGRQGAAVRHEPQPGAEFRQGVRHQVPRPRPEAGVRLDDKLGRQHAADRRDDHGPQRRRGAGPAAAGCAGRGGDRADLQERRRTRRRCAAFIDKLVCRPDRRRETQRRRSPATGSRSTSSTRRTEQRIVADFRDARPGDKQYHWEQRGVPFRIEVGPRDVDAGTFVLNPRG